MSALSLGLQAVFHLFWQAGVYCISGVAVRVPPRFAVVCYFALPCAASD